MLNDPGEDGMRRYGTLLCETDEDGILVITLNRPDHLNAFTPEMCEELVSAFEWASADESVRAVIVRGAGRGFCAGMDLSREGNVFGLDESLDLSIEALDARRDDPSVKSGVRDTGGRVTLAIRACRKPVIAALHGVAVGIGITMTLAMDVRLAAPGTRIGFVFGKLGISPEACSTWYLPRLVGMQKALEWVYAAEIFPAEEALAGGLLRSLHPEDELLAEARSLALRFTRSRSAAALAVTRELMWGNGAASTPWRAHLTESLAVHALSRTEGKEGVRAFREKRLPRFSSQLEQNLPRGFPWTRFDPEPA